MLPGDEIWAELEPRLGGKRPPPVVLFQADRGPADGGPPLSRILAWPEDAPQPHWLVVTCGLSASRVVPGYPDLGGIELLFRLARGKESSPPGWLADALQRLARDAFRDERPLAVGKTVDLAPLLEPIDTGVTAGIYARDPVLSDPTLVELVALTPAERQRATRPLQSTDWHQLLFELVPGGVTDLGRAARPRPEPPRGAAPAPAPPLPAAPLLQTLSVAKLGGRLQLSVASAEAPALADALLLAIRAGKLSYQGQGWTIHLNVEDIPRSATWATTLAVYFTVDLAKEAAAALKDPARHGKPLHFAGLPEFELMVFGSAQAGPGVLSRLKSFFGG